MSADYDNCILCDAPGGELHETNCPRYGGEYVGDWAMKLASILENVDGICGAPLALTCGEGVWKLQCSCGACPPRAESHSLIAIPDQWTAVAP